MSQERLSPIPLSDGTRLAGAPYQTQRRAEVTRVAGAGYQSILATQLGESPAAGPTERYKIGDRIGGRYEVLAIHRGSMGVVYGTFDHETQLPRALKTLQERFASKVKLRDLFLEEAAVWVKLGKHPYIVRAYLVEKYDGRPYVITEYVRGEERMGSDLAGWLGHGRLTLKLAVEMALQIAQGMQHAVRTIPGFVHRDLKPANILVDSRARAMVTDFGLVCATEAEAGTPAYMAPELWNGESPDTQTDIYAFGCILYEMLTGHRMFPANSVEEWRYAHLTQISVVPCRLRPAIPDEAGALVMRCLAKVPKGRPQDWDEVVNELAALFYRLTGQPAVFDFSTYEFTVNELILAGYSLWQLGKFEEMISACNRALEFEPDNIAALHNKGIALTKLGQHKESISCYDFLLRNKPDDAELWISKAHALSMSCLPGFRDEAISCFDKALKISPNHVAAWAGKGQELVFCNRLDEAIACCDRALEFDSLCGVALRAKNIAFQRLGRHDEILALKKRHKEAEIKNYERVRESAPNNVEELYALANLAFNVGHDDEGIAYLDRILEIEPDHNGALKGNAAALNHQGRNDESLTYYERVLKNDPENANEWYCKGNVFLDLRRHEEAITCFDRALEIDPYFDYVICAWGSKGHALFSLSRYEEAIACFDEALDAFEQVSTNAPVTLLGGKERRSGIRGARPVAFEYDVWFTKGMAFFYLGFYGAAIACFDHSLVVIDPAREEAKIQKDTALRMRNQVKAATSDK